MKLIILISVAIAFLVGESTVNPKGFPVGQIVP